MTNNLSPLARRAGPASADEDSALSVRSAATACLSAAEENLAGDSFLLVAGGAGAARRRRFALFGQVSGDGLPDARGARMEGVLHRGQAVQHARKVRRPRGLPPLQLLQAAIGCLKRARTGTWNASNDMLACAQSPPPSLPAPTPAVTHPLEYLCNGSNALLLIYYKQYHRWLQFSTHTPDRQSGHCA